MANFPVSFVYLMIIAEQSCYRLYYVFLWNCHANIDCEVHTYGLACRSNCGNCSRGEACNHVNGQCSRGCDRGVRGEKCQDGMNKIMHVMSMSHILYNAVRFEFLKHRRFSYKWINFKVFEVFLRNIYKSDYLKCVCAKRMFPSNTET